MFPPWRGRLLVSHALHSVRDPQHGSEIEADQMRDAHFVGTRLFVPQLAAKRARRRQFRREAGFDQSVPPRDGAVAEQIAGLPASACEIRHIAPRTLATVCSPLLPVSHFPPCGPAVLCASAHMAGDKCAARRIPAKSAPQFDVAQTRAILTGSARVRCFALDPTQICAASAYYHFVHARSAAYSDVGMPLARVKAPRAMAALT